MDNLAFKNQVITLKDGRCLEINGIKNVLSFTDGEIELECEGGKITVEGNDLKIESLSKDGGNLVIKGDITGVFKTPDAPPKRGFFGR